MKGSSEGQIDIRQVSISERGAVREFCDFPKRLYRNCPCWVPWFDRGLRRIIAAEHPFFEHSDGACFLVRRGSGTGCRTVARFALLEPRRFNQYRSKRDARFYFFDTENDPQVATAVFDFAAQWAHKRGLTRLIGPQGFSGFTGAGILIDGFERPAAMTMMNYTFSYYRPLIEGAGFSKYKDFVSAELIAAQFTPSQKQQRVMELVMKRNRFRVPQFRNRREFRAAAAEIGRIYNQSWEDHDEFVPLTERELKELTDDLLLVTDPGLIKVMRRDDQIVGFILGFPDVTRALQRAGGRLNPLSLCRILRARKRTRTFIINGVGILPEFRNQGGTALLFSTIERSLRERGVLSAEMTQIAETTELMLAAMRDLGGRVYKTHRVYQRAL
ncbi:MAG: N-acetyltransferase [Spirochaetaceae bacterium]|nr:MAG: N-acetyltransferase [Spirochaetaceae bacterium]